MMKNVHLKVTFASKWFFAQRHKKLIMKKILFPSESKIFSGFSRIRINMNSAWVLQASPHTPKFT